jgi:hypothetical protein
MSSALLLDYPVDLPVRTSDLRSELILIRDFVTVWKCGEFVRNFGGSHADLRY